MVFLFSSNGIAVAGAGIGWTLGWPVFTLAGDSPGPVGYSAQMIAELLV